MLCSSSKKVAVCHTIISNLAVTTHVSVNNVRVNLILKGNFITEQRTIIYYHICVFVSGETSISCPIFNYQDFTKPLWRWFG